MITSVIPSLIVLIAAAAASALLLISLLILDARRSKRKKVLRTHILEYVSLHTAQSFSVIVEIGESDTDELRSFLDMLTAHDYPKLQVVALLDQTVDPKTLRSLRKIQRQYKGNLPMRLVRSNPRREQAKLIRRYASGELYLVLKLQDILSKGFFKRVSLEFIDPNVDVVSPRVSLQVNDSLTRASLAIYMTWRAVIQSAVGKTDHTRAIIRRGAYFSATKRYAVTNEQTNIAIEERPTLTAYKMIAPLILAAITVTGVILSILAPYTWLVMTVLVIAVISLIPMIRLLTNSYSFWAKLSLVLLVPIWPVLMVLSYVSLNIFSRRITMKHVNQPAHTQ